MASPAEATSLIVTDSRKPEYSCPFCKTVLPAVVLKCPTCRQDLEDWVKLEHLELNDPRTLKVVMGEYVKRYVWKKTLTVLISGGVAASAIGIGWSVFEKARNDKLIEAQRQADETNRHLEDQARKASIEKQIEVSVRNALDKSVERDVANFERDLERSRERLAAEIETIGKNATALEADLNSKSDRAFTLSRQLESAFAQSQKAESQISRNYVEIMAARDSTNDKLKQIGADLEKSRVDLQTEVNKLNNFRTEADSLRQTVATEESKIRELLGRFEVEREKLVNAQTTIERQRDALNKSVTYDALRTILQAGDRTVAIDRAQALQSAPKIELVRPLSVAGAERRVVLGANIRLEWFYPGDLPAGSEFLAQVSGSPDFLAASTSSFPRSLATLDLPYESIKTSNFGNSLYWRVALRKTLQADSSSLAWTDTGSFDYFLSAMSRIRTTGKLRVGISSSYDGQFAYVEGTTRKGFEIELAEKIGRELLQDEGRTLEVVFIPYDWSVLLSSLKDNKVDLLIATISIRASRETTFGLKFTSPYYKSSSCVVYVKDVPPADFEKLGTSPVAVQSNSVNVSIAQKRSSNVREVSSTMAALEEVAAGRAFAAIMDTPFAEFQIAQQKLSDRLTYKVIDSDNYGIAVPAGEDELLPRLNKLVAKYEADGYLAELGARTLQRK